MHCAVYANLLGVTLTSTSTGSRNLRLKQYLFLPLDPTPIALKVISVSVTLKSGDCSDGDTYRLERGRENVRSVLIAVYCSIRDVIRLNETEMFSIDRVS